MRSSPIGTTKTVFPKINVQSGEFFFFPFNMSYGKTFVKTATVTPFTKIGTNNEIYVFYKRENDSADSNFFDFSERGNEKLLVLSKKDALNAWKMSDGRLIITDGDSSVIEDTSSKIEISTRSNDSIFVSPDFEKVPAGFKKIGVENKGRDG